MLASISSKIERLSKACRTARLFSDRSAYAIRCGSVSLFSNHMLLKVYNVVFCALMKRCHTGEYYPWIFSAVP